MKNIYTIIFSIISLSSGLGQITDNFQEWKSSNKLAPFDWEEPKNWTSTNALFEFIKPGITKDNLGAKLNTVNVFGKPKLAIMSIGESIIDYLNEEIVSEGIAVSAPLKSVTILYEYNNHVVEDTGIAKILIVDENGDTKYNVEVNLNKEDKQKYELVTASFQNGDRIFINILSGNPANPKLGGELIVKGVTIDVISDVKDYSFENSLYPNPSNGLFYIDLPEQIEGYTFEIYDADGKLITVKDVHQNVPFECKVCIAGKYVGVLKKDGLVQGKNPIIIIK